MAIQLINNEGVIDALKPGAGRLNDGGGLYLLPAETESKRHAWHFDYSFESKRQTISLGIYPDVSLEEAREKAVTARKQVASGLNPSTERKREKAAIAFKVEAQRRIKAGEAAVGSLEEVARRWYEMKKPDWTSGYGEKVIRRLELHVFPYLGSCPVTEVSAADVLVVCRRVEQQGTVETAHRVLELCSNALCLAVAESLIKSDPCRDLRRALRKPISKHFAAVTNPAELSHLLKALHAYHGTAVVRAALKLAPMLYQRPGELRQARWEEFDLDNGQWYVPSLRMKRSLEQKVNGNPHFVPLPTQAVEILEDLFLLTGRSGFVFPAEGRKGRTMSNGTVNSALCVLGYPSEVMTGHGFRAIARTLAVEVLGFEKEIVEAQLSHTVEDDNGTAYNRTEFLLRRLELAQAWADYLDELREDRADVRRHAALPAFKPVTQRLM